MSENTDLTPAEAAEELAKSIRELLKEEAPEEPAEQTKVPEVVTKAFRELTDTLQTMAKDSSTTREALEGVLERVEKIEDALSVTKAAQGQEGPENGKKPVKKSEDEEIDFGPAVQALLKGEKVVFN